jgi:hypothetical protein
MLSRNSERGAKPVVRDRYELYMRSGDCDFQRWATDVRELHVSAVVAVHNSVYPHFSAASSDEAWSSFGHSYDSMLIDISGVMYVA